MTDMASIKTLISVTPAFVLDLEQVVSSLHRLARLREASGCKVLYSIKALPLAGLLEMAAQIVDGFSVSSLFEAKLADEIGRGRGSIHLATPGIRADQFGELSEVCSHISFNSIGQFRQMTNESGSAAASLGLRINPKLSFVDDERYDPCRYASKLGVDLDGLQSIPVGIEGLHWHTVFGWPDFEPMSATLDKLRQRLPDGLSLKWLNLGGGYLYDEIEVIQPFVDLLRHLTVAGVENVYIEPGKAVVGKAGYLVTSVIDRFVSDGKTVLVLDTSVNHLPEVFEYQIQPRLLEQQAGMHSALLAGCTCLAGDLFGEYHFEVVPQIGDRLTFVDVGAYSLVKASRFNGQDLPAVYLLDGGELRLYRRYDYQDYRRQWLAD